MAEQVAAFFSGIPSHWIALSLASLPILELRGSIPWAILAGGMSWQGAFVWSVIGNFIPVIPILLLLEPSANYLRRWVIFDKFFNWLFARTRRKGKLIERYEALGLLLFVATPLPGTGAWTGALAAFVFGVRFRLSLPIITLGILLAGIIVTSVVVGGSTATKALLGVH
ncbi:ligand-binding protein SH3 [candidate division LCP-89 bacterium B3_LCP]|uniref:Ligand-binding protein SH3 n=1 Tax=candidate division LCP-89 bacterium B3_LCP TaxID=2012998 RepID=A0A532V3X1_UNCL8|nr:MAG: ligand-binding protein SH3 [candidate division LCP-89 bacterium B3_LCP]